MFRLHRTKPTKSGERVDFKFSNFHATQVPKGWDKIFVSIISVETGKTIAKSSKALVRNGICQWTDNLSESIWVSQDDTSKELEESLLKFVVTMGSARSGILGEATVNMTSYMNSHASVPVSLPLKKCKHGTILQVKIHCPTSRIKLRDEKSEDSNSRLEDLNGDSHDTDTKSDGSDRIFSRNVGSSSSRDLGSISQPGELNSKWILTTWTDEECKLIMKNCFDALPAGGKMIACEPVLPEQSDDSHRTRALLEGDIFVMTIYRAKGKHRTEEEFRRLGLSVGFPHFRAFYIDYFYTVLEFQK